MNKLKTLLASKGFWATAGVIAGAAFGAVGANAVKATETLACIVQTCQ